MTNIQLKISIEGKEANATLALTDDNIKELYQSFKYGKQEVNGLTTAISQGFNNAREIIQGFKEAWGVVKSAFADNLKAYDEQAKAEIKLQTALRQTGNYTDENYKSLKEYASQLQAVTLYGDETYVSIMGIFQAMGLNVEQTKEASLQTANLAALMDTDLKSAARVMGDLFAGNATMINRYVKGLDETIMKSGDTARIMAHLNERIGNQAVNAAKEGTGALQQMNMAVGDMKEETGKLMSEALLPFVQTIRDIVTELNNTYPGVSGVIGLLTSLTTAFVTLRITGILPAIGSIELFGTALTGLRATLIKTGLGAMIVALGYGLYKLSEAYQHFKQVETAADQSADSAKRYIREQALKKNKEQLEYDINASKIRQDELKKEIQLMQIQLKEKEKNLKAPASKRNVTEDQVNSLSEQLKTREELLKREEDSLKINTEVLENYGKQNTAGKTAANTVGAIKERIRELTEEQDKLVVGSEAYYRNLAEIERLTRMLSSTKAVEKASKVVVDTSDITDMDGFEMEILPDVVYGNVLDYARLTKQQELDIWYEAEIEKVSMYENSTQMLLALSEEYDRRKRELDEAMAALTIQVYSNMFGAISMLFAKHTAEYKIFAIIQTIMDTYVAAQAAYKSMVGIPVVGPTLAGIAAATAIIQGMARVKAIQETKVPGYADGGAIVGERGLEVISPAKDYAEGFAIVAAMTKTAIEDRLAQNNYNGPDMNAFIEKLDEWQNEFTLRFDGYDFVAGVDKISKRKNRLKY